MHQCMRAAPTKHKTRGIGLRGQDSRHRRRRGGLRAVHLRVSSRMAPANALRHRRRPGLATTRGGKAVAARRAPLPTALQPLNNMRFAGQGARFHCRTRTVPVVRQPQRGPRAREGKPTRNDATWQLRGRGRGLLRASQPSSIGGIENNSHAHTHGVRYFVVPRGRKYRIIGTDGTRRGALAARAARARVVVASVFCPDDPCASAVTKGSAVRGAVRAARARALRASVLCPDDLV
jgi:hypothetical protein